ncbi:hypothetical protein M6B38_180590 [Iris pallida]|uniref:Uncharacterized protein n=1 Tax=Iris pallida TaxID=29817 RepID=A0AAX6ENN2_IRIPA|nr:hypothetical protein M6B38_180590 [Iris pallida]
MMSYIGSVPGRVEWMKSSHLAVNICEGIVVWCSLVRP